MRTLNNPELRQEGWEILSKHLGVPNAVKFILMMEKGYGDYSQLKEKLFKGKKIDNLYNEIRDWEKNTL